MMNRLIIQDMSRETQHSYGSGVDTFPSPVSLTADNARIVRSMILVELRGIEPLASRVRCLRFSSYFLAFPFLARPPPGFSAPP